jgi:hypothetical protein
MADCSSDMKSEEAAYLTSKYDAGDATVGDPVSFKLYLDRTESVRGMYGEMTSKTQLMQVSEWGTTVCKTVGSAYVGSNPTPATTCINSP